MGWMCCERTRETVFTRLHLIFKGQERSLIFSFVRIMLYFHFGSGWVVWKGSYNCTESKIIENWPLWRKCPFICLALLLLCYCVFWTQWIGGKSVQLTLQNFDWAGSQKGTSATFRAVINRRTAPNTRLPELPWSLPAPSNFSTWVHNDCNWLWTKVDDVPSCWIQNVLILHQIASGGCHLF